MRAATLSVSAVLVAICAGSQLLFANADAALTYLDQHASQHTQDLIDLVKIPSISSLPGMSRQMPQYHLQT